MQGGGADIDKIVVYDDEDASFRGHLVAGLAQRLADRGVFKALPEVVPTALRTECVQALNETAAADKRAILIADLMSYDGSPKGARLLRAAGARPSVRDCTWRIALTRRTSPIVARTLDGTAHAMVIFREVGPTALSDPLATLAPLDDAIVSALKSSPKRPPKRVVVSPDGATDRHPGERERYLRRALGDNHSEQMAEAAFRYIEMPMNDLNMSGSSSEDPEWETPRSPASSDSSSDKRRQKGARGPTEVSTEPAAVEARQLIAHLRKNYPRLDDWTPERIKQELKAMLWSVSNSKLDQRMTPEILNITAAVRVTRKLRDHKDFAHETWLTPTQHKLAVAFLDAAAAAIEDHGGPLPSDRASGYTTVNEVFADTNYQRVKDALGLGHWETCYAVWTIGDWELDGQKQRQQMNDV